jgi:hypothetical protein
MSQLATNRQGFAPATITEAMEFSKMLADSSMVPKAYQGKPQDIMVCVQWGYEIGLAPMQALQNIAVINGKPSVYGDAAMALVQASPVCDGVEEFIEGEGTPNPVAVCIAHRKGRKPVRATFSVEDAKRAGLWGKQGPWQAYPKRMMQMRARGFALRDAFPDVLKGLITAEEAQDYPSELNHSKVAIKPANPLDMVAAPALPTSDPVVIEAALADVVDEPVTVAVEQQITDAVTVPAPVPVPDPEVEAVQAMAEEAMAEMADLDPKVVAVGYGLMVPGKELPFSIHQSLDEWAEAYEDLAEKTARAGKVPPRERMTKLRELKECNQATLERIDTLKRIRHTAAYQKRLNALGAAQ